MKFNSIRTFLTIIAIAALACMAANAGTITYSFALGNCAGCNLVPTPPDFHPAALAFPGTLESPLALPLWNPALFAGQTLTSVVINLTATDLLEHEVSYSLPALAQPTAIEGVRRLIAYQGVAYARLYLDRLRALIDADAACGTPGRLLKEVARQLAVRMSYEDVVRVAQAKIAPSRMRRIAREELRVQDEPFSVHDFLKPGIEEFCQLLPSLLARPMLALAERKGWLGRVYVGMEINSTSIGGYLRFLMLAKLRWLRPHGHRFKQEQAQIESWLSLIAEAARHPGALALEVSECARLIKGYGDTYARGLANYRSI